MTDDTEQPKAVSIETPFRWSPKGKRSLAKQPPMNAAAMEKKKRKMAKASMKANLRHARKKKRPTGSRRRK